MITMVQPLHVGNALRLFLEPPARAKGWQVARSTEPEISGLDDPAITIVYVGDEPVFVDTTFVPNDVKLYYRAFYLVGDAWVASPMANGIAAAGYVEQSTDVLSFLRDRLEIGLRVEVERGAVAHELGYVPVYTAAPSLEQDIRFPAVTVHLEGDDPSEHGLGEVIGGDVFDGTHWIEAEGTINNTRITVIGWCLNSDERIELRKALRRLVLANLPVFADKGFAQVEMSMEDIDSVNNEFPVPMFQCMGNFTCFAPVVVGGKVLPIRDVDVRVTNY